MTPYFGITKTNGNINFKEALENNELSDTLQSIDDNFKSEDWWLKWQYYSKTINWSGSGNLDLFQMVLTNGFEIEVDQLTNALFEFFERYEIKYKIVSQANQIY